MGQNGLSRRIVFLDVDGVLNDETFLSTELPRRREEGLTRGSIEWWAAMINPANVAQLNHIVQQTRADVVVCSSWRHALSLEDLEDVLKVHGFKGDMVGSTPCLERAERGEECLRWLADNHPRVTAFIALDDEEDYRTMRDRLVKTDWNAGGLLAEHAERAIALLRKPLMTHYWERGLLGRRLSGPAGALRLKA